MLGEEFRVATWNGEDMKLNDKFIRRNIFGKALLMPVSKNNITDDPIFLNMVGEQIFINAYDADKKETLIKKIVDMYNLKTDSEDAESVKEFVEQLMKLGLLVENN